MRAGELDRKIVIERVTETQNAIGEPVASWATFATVWAAVKPVRGREYFAAQGMQAEADSVFRIRWLDGVTPKMRISYDGAVYDIQHVAELGRRAGLELYARVHR